MSYSSSSEDELQGGGPAKRDGPPVRRRRPRPRSRPRSRPGSRPGSRPAAESSDVSPEEREPRPAAAAPANESTWAWPLSPSRAQRGCLDGANVGPGALWAPRRSASGGVIGETRGGGGTFDQLPPASSFDRVARPGGTPKPPPPPPPPCDSCSPCRCDDCRKCSSAPSVSCAVTPAGGCGGSGPSFAGTLYSTPSRARPVMPRAASCVACDAPPPPPRPPPPCGVDESAAALGRMLLRAAEDGDADAVAAALDAGAPVDFTHGTEWTPLHRAARRGCAEVTALLLSRGADLCARTRYGFTALHIAAYNDQCGGCVAQLLRAGADPNARNRSGRTPLHYAAEGGNARAAQALLAAGASRWIQTNMGETPQDVAKTNFMRQLLY